LTQMWVETTQQFLEWWDFCLKWWVQMVVCLLEECSSTSSSSLTLLYGTGKCSVSSLATFS